MSVNDQSGRGGRPSNSTPTRHSRASCRLIVERPTRRSPPLQEPHAETTGYAVREPRRDATDNGVVMTGFASAGDFSTLEVETNAPSTRLSVRQVELQPCGQTQARRVSTEMRQHAGGLKTHVIINDVAVVTLFVAQLQAIPADRGATRTLACPSVFDFAIIAAVAGKRKIIG